jgi:hypothetical protein
MAGDRQAARWKAKTVTTCPAFSIKKQETTYPYCPCYVQAKIKTTSQKECGYDNEIIRVVMVI